MNNTQKSQSKFAMFLKLMMMSFRIAPFDMSYIIISSAVSGVLPVVSINVWKKIYDTAYEIISGKSMLRQLVPFVGFLIVIELVLLILGVFKGYYANKVKERVKLGLLKEIHVKVSKVPLELYESSDFYNSIERAYTVINQYGFMELVNMLISVIQSAITCVGIALLLATFSPWLIPFSLISIFPTFFARLKRGKDYYFLKRYETPKRRKMNYLFRLITNKHSLKEIRVFNAADYLMQRWKGLKDELQEEEWRFMKKHGLIQLVVDGSRQICFGIGLLLCAILVIKKKLTIGVFGSAINAIRSMQDSFSTIFILLGNLEESLLRVGDVFYFLYDVQTEEWGDKKFDTLKHEIELKQVSFVYPKTEKVVLKDIDLKIKKGESISIIGLNGTGKTTLIKIILGLYRPTSGKVLIDGVELGEYNMESVYKRVSVVFQDFTRYSLSIKENIGFGDIKNMENDELLQSVIDHVELSYLYERYGLDTILSKEFGGIELSGGEWQRIAIARSMIRQYDMIILDEPTASLDPKFEAEVFKKFLELAKNKTSIIISHRIGSAKLADRILVMKDGGIVEDGHYLELIKLGGEFAKLYKLQSQWYD